MFCQNAKLAELHSLCVLREKRTIEVFLILCSELKSEDIFFIHKKQQLKHKSAYSSGIRESNNINISHVFHLRMSQDMHDFCIGCICNTYQACLKWCF